MPTNRSSRNTCRTRLTALLAAAVLTACGGGSSSATNETSTDTSRPGTATTTPVTLGTLNQPVSAANANGRLLASNCFQCHGTEGTGGFENIRRKSAAELKKFLTVPAGSDIMAAHAQGYTVAQLDAIAAYLNQ
jgi:sulfide dehydrogenase cytochrome subunit